MFAVVVRVEVLADRMEEFDREIRANAEASLRDEPGCFRFDVLAVEGSSTQFILYELYADDEAFSDAHRSSPHYARWKSASAGFLAVDGQQTILCNPAFDGSIAS